MNVRAETAARIRGVERAERERPGDRADLNPARGIFLAVGLSLLGWTVVLVVVLG